MDGPFVSKERNYISKVNFENFIFYAHIFLEMKNDWQGNTYNTNYF